MRIVKALGIVLLCVGWLAWFTACTGALVIPEVLAGGATAGLYNVHNLVSDGGVPADNPDDHLVNGWGIAFNPMGVVWVADNGTGFSTLYDGLGNPQSLVVTIPAAAGGDHGKPTGIVFNSGNDFIVTSGGNSGPARFIFVSEDGIVSAWAPAVDGTHALAIPGISGSDAIYKGLALAPTSSGDQLYAADFHNARVDVFDASFQPVTIAGAFSDSSLPKGFAPFGIAAINGNILVAYAQQDADAEDEVAGPGRGFIDVFDVAGTLLHRLVSHTHLNAPWGMALAPANFGKFSNLLLVGSFGDGTISAYDPDNGHFKGQLRGADHHKIKIDGLWGIAFGNGINNQPMNTLFFAAGPDDENHGVYGRIDLIPGSEDDSSDDGGD